MRTRTEVAEHHTIVRRRQRMPGIIVHSITISDTESLHDRSCGQFNRERAVLLIQSIDAILVGQDVVQVGTESHHTGIYLRFRLAYFAGVEPIDTLRTTKPKRAVLIAHRCILVELVELKAFSRCIVGDDMLIKVELRNSFTAAHPEVALSIGLRCQEVVGRKAILNGIDSSAPLLRVEYNKAGIGTKADLRGRNARNAVDHSFGVILFTLHFVTLLTDDHQPVVRSHIQLASTTIVAQGNRPIASGVQILTHESLPLFIIFQDAIAHRSHPHIALHILYIVIDIAGVASLVFNGDILTKTRLEIQYATSLSIRAEPYAMTRVLKHCDEHRRDRLGAFIAREMRYGLTFVIQAIDATIVCAYT